MLRFVLKEYDGKRERGSSFPREDGGEEYSKSWCVKTIRES